MSEIDQFIKAMSDGIRAFSKGMDILADQLDEYAVKTRSGKPAEPEQKETDTATEQPDTDIKSDIQSTPAEKPEEKPAKERKSVDKKSRGEVKPKKAPRPDSDTGKVYQVINESGGGVNVETLTEETGFNRQKIYGIVNRLKTQDKIKRVKQGVYEIV